MIPEFPQFKKLELSDKADVEKFTSLYPPYSDFNFISMWSWDIKGEMRLSVLNNNLVVRFTDYLSGEPFFSFLGNNKVNETAAKLLDFSKKEKVKLQLRFLPESAVEKIDITKFEIKEDRDHFDYRYIIEKLVNYDGREFLTKRNLTNRFLREYPDGIAKICDLKDPKTLEQILNLSRLWEQNKVKNSQDARVENESVALNRILVVSKIFKLITVGVYSENQLLCFCVNEILSGGNALSHFAKSDGSSSGSYAFLMKENAKVLKERGALYLNYEQDLGIPNLRHAKESFRPIGFLKKFICAYK